MSIFAGRIFPPNVFPARLFPHTASALLTDGTLQASNLHPTSVIITLLSEAIGGNGPYTHQLARALGAGAFAPIVGATGFSYFDSGLTPSTTYRYQDTVTDALSQTVTSNIVSITTPALPSFTGGHEGSDEEESPMSGESG